MKYWARAEPPGLFVLVPLVPEVLQVLLNQVAAPVVSAVRLESLASFSQGPPQYAQPLLQPHQNLIPVPLADLGQLFQPGPVLPSTVCSALASPTLHLILRTPVL